MKINILPSSTLNGKIKAIPSKSHAHRLIICSGLSDKESIIQCESASEDINATLRCMEALGAVISKDSDNFKISGIFNKDSKNDTSRKAGDVDFDKVRLDCGESGSTYRFLFPIVCALNSIDNNSNNELNRSSLHKKTNPNKLKREKDYEFILKGKLPERPMEPLFSVMEEHGIIIKGKGKNIVSVSGGLSSGIFTIPGNISSQFISGLLFALPLLSSESIINVTGKIESEQYIEITLDAIRKFGIIVKKNNNSFIIPGNQSYHSPEFIRVDRDWSNSAFWLCCGALSQKTIICEGPDINSLQGDKMICYILKSFGANISIHDNYVTCVGGNLKGIRIDASQIPDLIPAIAAVACGAEGITEIFNAERLRIKESNRLKAITDVLSKLGADITETANGLIIKGQKNLSGGKVDSWNDHRIVMMAAIASTICNYPVEIENPQAVNKSYPDFFKDFSQLGGIFSYEQEN